MFSYLALHDLLAIGASILIGLQRFEVIDEGGIRKNFIPSSRY
jgi:hypothetical protein